MPKKLKAWLSFTFVQMKLDSRFEDDSAIPKVIPACSLSPGSDVSVYIVMYRMKNIWADAIIYRIMVMFVLLANGTSFSCWTSLESSASTVIFL